MKGGFNKRTGFRDFGMQEDAPTTFFYPAGKTDISISPVFP
jgi:hypothetical protein